MSYNIRNIREISNDPLTKFTNQLAKKLSKFLTSQQTEKLENKEDIYSDGQDIDVILRLENFIIEKYFDYNTQYYSTFEPDDTYNTLWLRGISIGSLKDYTASRQDGGIIGAPTLVDGDPFDWGINVGTGGTKSIALRLNRPTSDLVNTEYIYVPDTDSHQINGITTGISYFIRFRVSDLSQEGGLDRGLFAKIDDLNTPDPNNGIMVILKPDGRVSVTISRAGVKQEKVTGTGSIVVDTVYDMWIIFNDSGDVIKVYINNVDKTLTTGTSNYGWQNTTSTNLRIFRRGFDNTNGFVEGDFYDFRIYRNLVVSTAQVGYMYTNKWTIADIPFGQVAITNYFATYNPPAQQAFTTAGFTSTGYDT